MFVFKYLGMRKKFLLVVFFVIFLIIVSIIIKKNKRTQIKPKENKNRKYELVIELPLLSTFKDAYRIDIIEKKLLVISENIVYEYDLDKHLILDSLTLSGAYTCTKILDTLVIFNTDTKSIQYYFQNKKIKELPLSNAGDDAIVCEQGIYYFTKGDVYNFNEYTISKVNDSLKFKIMLALNDQMYGVDSLSKSHYIEGRIRNLDSNNILYLPYNFKKIFVINKRSGQYSIHNTIEEKEKVIFNRIESKYDGSTMIKFEPNDGIEFVHFCLAINKKYVMINSSDISYDADEAFALIDFYDATTFKYQFTKKIKNILQKDQVIFDIKADTNFLYVLTGSGNIYKIKI